MSSEHLAQKVREAALAVLTEGPMPLDGLVGRLRSAGALAHLDGMTDLDLADEVDEILLDTDDTWMSEDGMVALTTVLLDGAVFSHRLTASELERGVIDITPDLGAVDFDLTEELETVHGELIACRYPFEGEEELDENGSYVGPIGWLGAFDDGDVVCLRRIGKQVSLERPVTLGQGELELQALRRALAARDDKEIGVEPHDLVLDALCHDPSLFRSPVVPVGELLEQVGLEARGAWFGPKGGEWQPPGARHLARQRAELSQTWNFGPCCEDAFDLVREAWGEHVLQGGGPPSADLRSVARALLHSSVAPAFAQYVLGEEELGCPPLCSFATELSRLPGKLAAPGLYLRGLERERNGETAAAEADLQASVRANPEFAPALEELAWYTADSGDAARAISLLRRAGVTDGDPELDYLTSLLGSPGAVRARRNEPCPCGSGRKFKACCLNSGASPLESRAGWLYHKIVVFSLRPQRREMLETLVEIATGEASAGASEHLLPVLVDLAAMDDDAMEAFLGARGELLPRDELDLARSWVGSRLVLWEVTELEPGASATLRDTGTGDHLLVAERSASRTLRPGQYVLARVVAAGSQHQIIGAPLKTELRHRSSLMALLDADPEPEEIAAWLGAAFAAPSMANNEGEDVVLCRARLRPRATSWGELSKTLDALYGVATTDSTWAETTEIAGETIVRSVLRRDGSCLVVETNSIERVERLLAALRDAVANDLEVVEDERLPLEGALVRHASGVTSVQPGEEGVVPPELARELASFIRQKEQAWLDESIPALGGLTPREAATDPTRREDLLSLLAEFERFDDSRMASFDVSRLRDSLGLSGEGP